MSSCLYWRIQVLVYPSKGAISIEKFISRNGPIQRFVFLDATWFQVGGLRILPQIEELQTVVLKSYKTQYWRPQHLATIEAIYYAIREAFEASTSQPYEGQFDDLLFWFFYFRSKRRRDSKNRICLAFIADK
uniref:tRNA-uridine aminocarboxypropyltransferase 1 n=1 Tax=Parascaris equorum TaxID=6256 RepID=A0A914RBI5_PAREQ